MTEPVGTERMSVAEASDRDRADEQAAQVGRLRHRGAHGRRASPTT